MAPRRERLIMYGEPSSVPLLEWRWVDTELTTAGTYWVTASGGDRPHPRPVWGVWAGGRLALSIGSPVLTGLIERDPNVTVHLESSTDVVIVEGTAAGPVEDAGVLQAYNDKYDWNYATDDYGPLTSITPTTVLAWRSAGWAGREGFQQTGRWRFAP